MAIKVHYEVLYFCKPCDNIVPQVGTLKLYKCILGHTNTSTNGVMKEVLNGDLGAITKLEKEMKRRDFKPFVYDEPDLWDDNETLCIGLM